MVLSFLLACMKIILSSEKSPDKTMTSILSLASDNGLSVEFRVKTYICCNIAVGVFFIVLYCDNFGMDVVF